MKTKQRLISLTAGALLGAASAFSFADVESSVYYLNPVIYSDGAAHALPITSSGGTIAYVYASNVDTRAVFFNAECAVQSADNFTWFDINLEVTYPNGTVSIIAPSNSDNAFCTGHGNNILGTWSSNETHGTFYASQTGWYRIRVIGQLMGYTSGERVRMDDMSLIVMD
ncbi:hypothetical protein ONV78_22010 [Hahella sp. CR1]|uniref:hypothetical protein n=1 Tax=Hahella sp. CR1 TaxID=2992807 RepID=UPI0024425D71|nr:hypothetical protein [Hahella sp. CR1]MDG9670429.1 hypothetical protein [Hahella sp. CR1]